MRKLLATAGWAVACAVLLGGIAANVVSAASDPAVVAQGKEIAFDRKKGNCLACHAIDGGDLPGNIGPPLVAMDARFPDKERLRAQIWDPTAANPNTMMPPFGLHGILTEDEIDKITEYIHTL
jgi:sulfur-oxidizing protein SoxX